MRVQKPWQNIQVNVNPDGSDVRLVCPTMDYRDLLSEETRKRLEEYEEKLPKWAYEVEGQPRDDE